MTFIGQQRRSNGRIGPSSVRDERPAKESRGKLMVDDIERTRPKYPEEMNETTQDEEPSD